MMEEYPKTELTEERAQENGVPRDGYGEDLADWLAAERRLTSSESTGSSEQSETVDPLPNLISDAVAESQAVPAEEPKPSANEPGIDEPGGNESRTGESRPDEMGADELGTDQPFFSGMTEEPFGITPDPAYLYASRTHSEALASLSFGLGENRGFLALIAEPGMGKTTMLFQLLQELKDSARAVFLFQTQCDAREFVRYILHGLDINTEGMNLVAMHDKLNEVLFQEMLAGKRFVLVVDEAQNLDESVLETLRMLSNYEAHHTKLMQIVLAGQPQLAAKLAQPELLQLRQRISVLAHLEPLGVADVRAYLAHRLAVAGYRGEALFDRDAIALIAHHSCGIPRNINNLCYHALQIAHGSERRTITPEIVQEAAKRLDLASLIPTRLGGAEAGVAADGAPLFGSLNLTTPAQLTYKPGKGISLPRWPFRAVALAMILLVGSGLLALMERGKPTHASSSEIRGVKQPAPAIPAPLGGYTADPQTTGTGQVITVVVRPKESLTDICLTYAGHYDPDLLEEVRTLNPGVDPDHLIVGQLIQIPLPPNTLRKGN